MGKKIVYGVIIGVIMVLLIPAWEAIFGSITRDDCRVVNLEKILELNDGNITFYRTSEGGVHTVTYDSYGKHYDLSKSFIEDAPLKIQEELSNMSYTEYENKFIKGNTIVVERFKNGKAEEYDVNDSVDSWVYHYYISLFSATKNFIESL